MTEIERLQMLVTAYTAIMNVAAGKRMKLQQPIYMVPDPATAIALTLLEFETARELLSETEARLRHAIYGQFAPVAPGIISTISMEPVVPDHQNPPGWTAWSEIENLTKAATKPGVGGPEVPETPATEP